MNAADLHYLITNLPIVAAFVAGVWYADRRAQKRGERLGELEKDVNFIRGKLGIGSRENRGAVVGDGR